MILSLSKHSAASVVIYPIERDIEVQKGNSALLTVYFSATFSISGSNIMWLDPRSRVIQTSTRFFLMESNSMLNISVIELGDAGKYTITISKEVGGTLHNSSTEIMLNIQCKWLFN